ncbi:MAG: M13 family metallopeptidase [Verrucomicrobia bacterium]|nr:M13 family metallopeptidase [Verrucomicrobiota bacterium]
MKHPPVPSRRFSIRRHPLFAAAATALTVGCGLLTFLPLTLQSSRAEDNASATAAATKPRPLDPANLDQNAKPTENFYQFADGGWMARNSIPSDRARWGAFEEIEDRNYTILHAILEECAAHPGAAGGIRQKVGDYFAAGMDEARANAEGAKPLAAEFAAIEKLTDRSALPGAVARLHLLAMDVLFDADSGQDEKNSQQNIALLVQAGLGLPDRDYYTKDDEKSQALRQQYVEHMTKMFALLGDDATKAAAEANVVMKLETGLASASKTRVECRDPSANYHKMKLADLENLALGFDWAAYFKAIGVADPGDIDVKQPEFFTKVGQLASSTSVDDWKAYLRWHLLHATAPDLSQNFVDENFQFYGATLTGAKEIRPRWKRILRELDPSFGGGGLGDAIGQLFVEKTFTPEAKKRALTLVEDLRSVLSERIAQLDWMGAETKAAAQKKLAGFVVKIGYPDQWRDYSKLEIKRQSHVLNVMAANAAEVRRRFDRIGKPVDRKEWNMTTPTVNAYYNKSNNEIVFPAGILQPPFFDENADDAVNYGAIGSVIGHEMTHGFDDQGRQYDLEGNLKNWWTAEDEKRFKERGEKIVAQFNGYQPLPDAHINGALTEGENIADLGGVKIAYEALQKALARQGAGAAEKKIDGFTPAQRFFLSWAQVWRNNIRPEALRLRLNTDPHAPGEYRVNGPLSNLPEFQAAFNVPAGSPMVRPPAERVLIW